MRMVSFVTPVGDFVQETFLAVQNVTDSSEIRKEVVSNLQRLGTCKLKMYCRKINRDS